MRKPSDLPWALRGVTSFTRADADRHGVNWRRLAAPDLERAFHGVRRHAASAATVRDVAEAYARRMPQRQVFTHATAAQLWGIPLPAHVERRPELHVSVPSGSARPAGRGVSGHVLNMDRVAIRVLSGVRLVDPASAWCQLGSILRVDDLVATADYLLTGREPVGGSRALCSRGELDAALLRFRGCRGAASLARALGLARHGPLSRRETLLRLDLVRGGLPEPVPNLRVLDDGGAFLALVDLAYPRHRVGLEYQSDLHRPAEAYRRDVRRLERLVDAGWSMIQVTSDDVSVDGEMRDSAELRRRVARRLSERGWTGG